MHRVQIITAWEKEERVNEVFDIIHRIPTEHLLR